MITGEENILQISEEYPELIQIFEKHGLGAYFKPENLAKTGRFIKLNTLLKSSDIESKYLIETLNMSIESKIDEPEQLSKLQQQLHLVAMLPCGLRNPFKEIFDAHIVENNELYSDLNYLVEGNVNHELSYYPLLDSVENVDELPDIIIASDVNNFFHKPFMEKFVSKKLFETYTPYIPNSYLEKEGYADPSGNFTMFTANMLVLVIDKKRLSGKKIPKKWADILSPDFENEIIMRGENDFFCNAVMLPFYKAHGFDAIKALAHNIKAGKHPAEMVKLAGSGKDEAAAIYIMPYFFSEKIKKEQVEVVWPEDGAIASPVFMLVKKEKAKKHEALLNFLLSKKMGKMLIDRSFPSIYPDVNHDSLPESVSWLGWDFLIQNDIGKLKNEIQEVFMDLWNKKGKDGK